MKKTLKLFWIIAIVAAIGFSITACGGDDGESTDYSYLADSLSPSASEYNSAISGASLSPTTKPEDLLYLEYKDAMKVVREFRKLASYSPPDPYTHGNQSLEWIKEKWISSSLSEIEKNHFMKTLEKEGLALYGQKSTDYFGDHYYIFIAQHE